MTNAFFKKMLSVVVIMLLLLSSTITINAATTGTLDCTVSEFISDDGGLYITISGEAKGSVSVFVYDSSVEPTDFSSTNMPLAFNQYDLKGNLTTFEYKVPLPAKISTGTYNIKVIAKDGSYKFIENYFYFDESSAENATKAINEAILVSSSAIGETLSENAEDLLIEQEELDTYGEFISDLFFSRKDADDNHIQFETATDLMKMFTEAKAIYNVTNRNSDKTLADAIADNRSALGIELTADYQTNLTPAAKTELYSLLEGNKDWETRPYVDVYKEMAAFASVKKSENWSTLKSVVTDLYKDIINIDTTEYEDILDDVFVEMITYPFNSFEDISDNFDKAIEAITEEDDSNSSSSSSGGRRPSGGSSGMSVVGGVISNIVDDNTTEKESVKFSDLPDNHWAIKEINYLVENKVFTGYPNGTFGGGNPITRAEFATIIAKAFSLSGSTELPFEDVSADSWYKQYVSACYSNGIINGTSAATFSPEATITREDASVMIYRVLSNVVAAGDSEATFADNDEIADYAVNAIKALYNAKLINGVGDNKFAPKVCIDRQSAAKLIYDAIMIKK